MKLLRFILLFTVLGGCLYVLFFQPELLGINLSKNSDFPLGSLVSWFIIITFVLFVYLVLPAESKTKSDKKYKTISAVFILISALWGVFSRILAGNWSWVFNDMRNFYVWVLFTTILILVPSAIFIVHIFRRIFRKNR
ncbi:hypothetical protein GM418_18110 [Maribellus comscasis]|uniref:Uncharacterized protein n=1 Tax=Maribellus comscasis TaxID=2681766 RepID=A0A6I6K687_9BACT|nr:hypothetical protein [Maribellus comscasis]QGY45514.1 hypothetical protein GM418_18110 [Maribellus comscasis]